MLTAIHTHYETPIQMPRMLELEVFELRDEFPDVEKSKKYANFRDEYSIWSDAELISRLRILCMNARDDRHEVLAVYDEFEAR
jgi:hypothetical protein